MSPMPTASQLQAMTNQQQEKWVEKHWVLINLISDPAENIQMAAVAQHTLAYQAIKPQSAITENVKSWVRLRYGIKIP